MIIAVDYDDTLEIGGDMNLPLITKLKIAQAQGHIIILWTCRNGKSLTTAVQNLMKCGFKPNIVNDNAPQTVKALGYNSRKVLADIYIDDKNGVI